MNNRHKDTLSNLLVFLIVALRKKRRRINVLRQRRPDEQPKREHKRSLSSKVRKKPTCLCYQHRVRNILTFGAETLLGHDQQICSTLEEKLQLYAELTELTLNSPEPVAHRHLLVPPDTDSEIPPQATSLLTAALREGKGGVVLCCDNWWMLWLSLVFYKHNDNY